MPEPYAGGGEPSPGQRIADARGVKPHFFDEAYLGTPPWEIGAPQPAVVRLLAEGFFRGPVVDIGCGQGENARAIAAQGHQVLAFDPAARAVQRAREAAHRCAANVQELLRFEVASALDLGALVPAAWAQTLLDSGVFHVFSDGERPHYCAELARIAAPGCRLAVICFSEHEDRPGPRRVRRDELESAFCAHWLLDDCTRVRYSTQAHAGGADCWLSRWTRRG